MKTTKTTVADDALPEPVALAPEQLSLISAEAASLVSGGMLRGPIIMGGFPAGPFRVLAS